MTYEEDRTEMMIIADDGINNWIARKVSKPKLVRRMAPKLNQISELFAKIGVN